MTEEATMVTVERRVLSLDVGVRNLGVAIIQTTGRTTTDGKPIFHVERLELRDMATHCGSSAKCKGMPKLVMARHAGRFLYDMEAEWDVAAVTDLLVEGQLRKAPLNTCLMCVIFAWFQRFQTSKGSPDQCAPMVQVGAKKKLAEEGFIPKYRDRKNAAVEKLGHLIQAGCITIPSNVHVRYCMQKKKDDMADAVLQAVAYLSEESSDGRKRKRVKKTTNTEEEATSQSSSAKAPRGKGKGKKQTSKDNE